MTAPLDYLTALKSWPADWRFDWEERAAILEFDAGLHRIVAERRAFELELARHRAKGEL